MTDARRVTAHPMSWPIKPVGTIGVTALILGALIFVVLTPFLMSLTYGDRSQDCYNDAYPTMSEPADEMDEVESVSVTVFPLGNACAWTTRQGPVTTYLPEWGLTVAIYSAVLLGAAGIGLVLLKAGRT